MPENTPVSTGTPQCSAMVCKSDSRLTAFPPPRPVPWSWHRCTPAEMPFSQVSETVLQADRACRIRECWPAWRCCRRPSEFGETDLDVVVAVPVQLGGRKTERTFQFACGAGFELCPSADNGGKIALDFFQHQLATGLQDGIRNAVKVAAELGIFRRKSSGIFMSHLANGRHLLLCQHLNVHPHAPLHPPRTQCRSDSHRR